MANVSEKAISAKTTAKRRSASPASSDAIREKVKPVVDGLTAIKLGTMHPEIRTQLTLQVEERLARVKASSITYSHAQGIDAFVTRVARATPMEIVEVERNGIDSVFLKDLSKHMDVPAVRIFDIVGIPKATAEKKVAAKELIAGAGGHAALGLARLLALAQDIVANSTAAEAQDFDVAKWLGHWIERPQPALGGRKPADLIGTPTGLDMVTKVLGAIESGAYQ